MGSKPSALSVPGDQCVNGSAAPFQPSEASSFKHYSPLNWSWNLFADPSDVYSLSNVKLDPFLLVLTSVLKLQFCVSELFQHWEANKVSEQWTMCFFRYPMWGAPMSFNFIYSFSSTPISIIHIPATETSPLQGCQTYSPWTKTGPPKDPI